MTITKSSFSILLLTFLISALPITTLGYQERYAGTGASSQQAPLDVSGTWSGSFQSMHQNMSPFTMTVVIAPDSRVSWSALRVWLRTVSRTVFCT